MQHITYRLADALPRNALLNMQEEMRGFQHDEEVKKVELRRRIEAYLDAGYGSCLLKEPEVARIVIDNWMCFDQERYNLLAWVVMPNHCHVLIETLGVSSLGKIVLSWKSYTAKRINAWKRAKKEESRGGPRRSQQETEQGRGGPRRSQEEKSPGGRVWQREYWDRYIRDLQHFETTKWYIENNPVKAGLAATPESWPWSSAAVSDKG